MTSMTNEVREYKKRSMLPEIWRRFKKNKRAVLGLVILICLVLVAVFANLLPYDPYAMAPTERLQTSSLKHWMGTDEFGRDILTRVCYGARLSIAIAFIATAFACVSGTLLGAVAGFYGGKLESVIMRVMDVLLAIPNMLLAIVVAAVLGAGAVNMMLAVAISNMPHYVRLMRSSVLSVQGQEYIEASRSVGASDWHIIKSHIIPNCLAPLIVQVTTRVGAAILICSSLSFIGVGISPPTAEWGAMLSKGKEFLREFPHLTLWPGLAIMVTAFALNMLGDGLRDALDPKMKT